MRWHFLGRHARLGRQRTHSRPRVANAALAARNVQLEMGAGATVSAADERSGAGLLLAARAPARSGGLGSAQLAASPAALLAAARATNRSVEDVWEETLAAWLSDDGAARRTPQSEAVGRRRLNVWHDIDATLLMLRAG